MDIIEVFSHNLKKYRILKGYSQAILSQKTGLHRTYISALECKKRNIALDNIQKIATALEIDTYLLFMDNERSETYES